MTSNTPAGPTAGGVIPTVDLDTLISILSHDLKTPLTAVKGAIGVTTAGMSGEMSPQALELLAVADRNVETAVALVGDLVHLFRLWTEGLTLELETCDLNVIALHALRPLHDLDRLNIEPHLSKQPVWTMGDDRLLWHALHSALMFLATCADTRTVGIRTELTRDWAIVEVAGAPLPVPQARLPELLSNARRGGDRWGAVDGGPSVALPLLSAVAQLHGGNASTRIAEDEKTLIVSMRLPTDRQTGVK